MTTKRKIEIFSAGCAACNEAVKQVKSIACPSCDISVLDMHEDAIASRAKALGVRSIPAIAINGTLADCCASRGIDLSVLRAAGVGSPIE